MNKDESGPLYFDEECSVADLLKELHQEYFKWIEKGVFETFLKNKDVEEDEQEMSESAILSSD